MENRCLGERLQGSVGQEWEETGDRIRTHTHTHRDLWDAVRFGKELPFSPTNEAWKSSLPGKGPDWMASRQPSARLSERVPPTPGTLPSPLPQPQRMQQFTLWIYYCSHSCPPPPWEEPAAWQEPAVSLWVPTSPLISTQSPCARVRPLRGLMPAKANLSPCIPQHGWPGRPVTPALQWTAPRQGGRSELAQQACGRMQGLWGGRKAKIT